MAVLKFLLRVVLAALSLAGPLALLLGGVALLCLGVHWAAEPLARLARTLLDVVDTGVDACMTGAIRLWASLWSWQDARVDAVVERAAGWVDVPEKLTAVHVVGLVVEGVLLLGVLPLAWRAEPPACSLLAPQETWKRIQAWWRGLSAWLRLERAVLLGLILAGAWVVGEETRASAVAAALVYARDLSAEDLRRVGNAAALLAVLVCAWCVGLPLLSADVAASRAAGRTRRMICLAMAPLLLMAALEAVW